MNIHITYALLAVFATILIAPAYGQGASPITISTDSDTYDHESKIFVTGSVDTIRSGIQQWDDGSNSDESRWNYVTVIGYSSST